MKPAFPAAVLKQHVAILGKTGSGKTSTEKVAVEQVVADGFRVCVLDTTKSDWWGITSSADGKRAGLPFQILGGPRGHVPLHSSAGKVIGQLVGSGKLPLSIIDMADFEAGGLQRFFIDFAQALMRSAKGVIYLVIEEAHELAPKEKSGIGNENMATHWAKKLATAGRSKGIRLIVATQRVQALHNAVLGSCETVIAHRLTTPADQEPVLKWLKANSDKETLERVAGSLSSLPTGTGWMCSGEAGIFEQVKFPKFKTYDNTATPTGDGDDIDVVTAKVDLDQLRTVIGTAVQEAEANDPKALRAEINRLNAVLKNRPANITEKITADPDAERRGFARGIEQATKTFREHSKATGKRLVAANEAADRANAMALSSAVYIDAFEDVAKDLQSGLPAPIRPGVPSPRAAPPTNARARTLPSPEAGGDGSLSGPERRIVNSLATWRQMGHQAPSNAQVAWLAGYSPTSTSYTNPRGALSKRGVVAYPNPDRVALTPVGEAAGVPMSIDGGLLNYVLAQLPGPEARILSAIAAAYPNPISNEDAATAANYSAWSTSYTNPRGALKTKELISYPSGGMVLAAEWLF